MPQKVGTYLDQYTKFDFPLANLKLPQLAGYGQKFAAGMPLKKGCNIFTAPFL